MKLKPCVLDGGEAVRMIRLRGGATRPARNQAEADAAKEVWIECTTCAKRTQPSDHEAAVREWNRRPEGLPIR